MWTKFYKLMVVEHVSLNLNKNKRVQRKEKIIGHTNNLPEMMMEHRINLNSPLSLFQLQTKQSKCLHVHSFALKKGLHKQNRSFLSIQE